MIEVIVFLVPIVVIGTNVYQRFFNSENSAVENIIIVNEYGVKGLNIKQPSKYLCLSAFIISPVYISMGWAWMILGIMLLASSVALIFFDDIKVTMPEIGSDDFDNFVDTRKKKALIGTIVTLIWVVSWL